MRAWPAAAEGFVRDHIGLRSAAISGYNWLVYFGLRTSPTPTVVRGRDGWLFYNSSAEFRAPGTDTIADARRSRPLGRGKIRAIADTIQAHGALVSSWHGRYLFAVVPNKSSVYTEMLPAALTPVGRGKPLEQLAERLAPAPEGPLLDLTPVMLETKRKALAYHLTDSHWTEFGAVRALGAILRVLQADYPGLRVPREEDLVVEQRTRAGGDLAMMLSLWRFFREPTWHLTPKPGLALPAFQRELEVWVYRDSFYETLPHLWRAYLPGIVVQRPYTPWDDERLRAARPDVVIQLVVERRLRLKGRQPEAHGL